MPGWGGHDRYLREAMFGPRFPRSAGRAGVPGVAVGDGLDHDLPGFGPFGTAGAHCFDPAHPVYVRVAAIIAARRAFPVLRAGRQYLRSISVFGEAFATSGPGELVAWSRILVDEEALCVVNPNGVASRGADVVVDATLNPPGSALTVIVNSAEAAGHPGSHLTGSQVQVQRRADGTAYVALRDLGASESLVLTNRV
jgi:hypothetical protein